MGSTSATPILPKAHGSHSIPVLGMPDAASEPPSGFT